MEVGVRIVFSSNFPVKMLSYSYLGACCSMPVWDLSLTWNCYFFTPDFLPNTAHRKCCMCCTHLPILGQIHPPPLPAPVCYLQTHVIVLINPKKSSQKILYISHLIHWLSPHYIMEEFILYNLQLLHYFSEMTMYV